MLVRRFPIPVTRMHTISLTNLRQENAAKERLPDTPDGGGGTLGLAAAAGSAVIGTTTNNSTAAESVACSFRIPGDYRDNENLTIRVRCFFSAARNGVSNLLVFAQLIKDGALDATNLDTTGVTDVKAVVSATDQDVDIDGSSVGDLISAGDLLRIQVLISNNDTGGSSNGFFQMDKLSVLVPSWE